jgi:hypothetical protein
VQTSSIGELEEEGGPEKGEAQRHWLQESVVSVCLSFRRYFYNKIRNYEARQEARSWFQGA